MNILFVTQWYPNRQQPFFGIFVREHARAVQSAGHTVLVLAVSLHKSRELFIKKSYQYTDEYGIRTIQCELHSRLKDVLFHLPDLQQYFLNQTYFHEKGQFTPDLIHSQVIYPAGIWGNVLARRFNVPHVITEHWSRLAGFSKSIYFAKGKKAYAGAGAILPVSGFLKTSIQTLVPELNDSKFTIVGNVVDQALFTFQNTEKKSDELVFCAVATWQHKKNPDKMPELFIDALAALQKQLSRKLKLVIIGGGNKVADMEKRCKNAELDTRFTGFLAKEHIAEELHKADYFVHASTIETFSIVVAEALACGLPVICSNTGALPELVDESNGVLCENTLPGWTAALEKAIATPYDRSAIASQLHQRFSHAAIGAKIAGVYQKLHL